MKMQPIQTSAGVGKTSIDIDKFRGINTLHTRLIGEPSSGKNFLIVDEKLRTREGCSLVTSDFSYPIKSIHSAPKVNMETKLVVEVNETIWQKVGAEEEWEDLQGDAASNYGYSSVLWTTVDETGLAADNLLLMAGGRRLYVYSIDTGGIGVWSNFATGTSGVMPKMDRIWKHEDSLFGCGLTDAYPNRIYVCGLDENGNISHEYWPENNWFDVSTTAAEPTLEGVSLGGHMIIFTTRRHYRVYFSRGSDASQDDISVDSSEIGKVGLYKMGCAAKVGNLCIWLTQEDGDFRVYAYSGSEALPISEKVESLFAGHSFTNVFCFENGGQFWLVLPNSPTSKTTVFVYDKGDWFIYEYPFVINCAAGFGTVMGREYVHLGLNDNRIVKIDDSEYDLDTYAIENDMTIGPISGEGNKIALKRLYLTAEPDYDLVIDVFGKSDGESEISQDQLVLDRDKLTTSDIRLCNVRGYNVSLRLNTDGTLRGVMGGRITVLPGVSR